MIKKNYLQLNNKIMDEAKVEETHESANIMANELLQHPTIDQNMIIRQFIQLVLRDRTGNIEEVSSELQDQQKKLEDLRGILANI